MEQRATYPTDTLFKGLRALISSLPSEEEKKALMQTLRDAQDFLGELQKLIEAFPTVETSQGLTQGLSHLDIMAERVSSNAPLRRLMGLKSSQSAKGKSTNGKQDIKSRAIELENRVASSESADVENTIQMSGEPVSVLCELASSLGLRTRKKERRAELVHRIATHLKNQRGYKVLRDGTADALGYRSSSQSF